MASGADKLTIFRPLPGLPPYGPLATSFPGSFVRSGSEGYVVEFFPDTGDAWVANFRPGLGGYSGAHMHPNETDVVVFAKGTGYVIDASARELKKDFGGAIAHVWEQSDPPGLLCDRQGLAFFLIGRQGV